MEYTYGSLLKYFSNSLKPYFPQFLMASFFRLISAILGLVPAYIFAQIITYLTKYTRGESIDFVYKLLALWTLSFLIRFVLIHFAKMWAVMAGEKAALDTESKALLHLSLLNISWHEKENSGNKIKRIQRGADGISTLLRIWIVTFIDLTVNFIGTFFVLMRTDISIALLLVAYQIIYFFVGAWFKYKVIQTNKPKSIKEEESSGLMFEIMNNIRSVKVLGMAKPILDHLQKVNDELIVRIHKNLFWFQSAIDIRSTIQSIGRIGILVFIVYGISKGIYQLGFLVIVYGYFNTVSNSVEELSNASQDVAIAKTNVGRLLEFLSEKIHIDNEEGKVNFPQDWDGIHIKNLSFSYDTLKVLDDISFDVRKGEKVGIVGLSGAGKSTLFKLLLKEYEVLEKSILFGNTPIQKIKKSDFVGHCAAVLQETEVFNFSLKKNIIISNNEQGGNSELLEKSLTISHVYDFIHKLPKGLESLIGEKGIRLSGGERQRLGIARAVFKNPEILFLDEATSHLDVESEGKIQDSLQHFFKDVTAIVIAHRLSTIKEMDRIIVLEHGKIIETGTFDELYNLDKRFREFWDKQKL